MTGSQSASGASQGHSEFRKPDIDGWRWPFRRSLMRDADAIRARMFEDLQILSLDGYPDEDGLTAKGWTLRQIADHGVHALDRFFYVAN